MWPLMKLMLIWHLGTAWLSLNAAVNLRLSIFNSYFISCRVAIFFCSRSFFQFAIFLLFFVVGGALFFSCQYVFRLLFNLLLVMHIFGLGLGLGLGHANFCCFVLLLFGVLVVMQFCVVLVFFFFAVFFFCLLFLFMSRRNILQLF
jgi:hypothetical protein